MRSINYSLLTIPGGRNFILPVQTGTLFRKGLDLYATQNIKGILVKKIIKWSSYFHINKIILKNIKCYDSSIFNGDKFFDIVSNIFQLKSIYFAVSMGTPGTFQKPVIQIMSDSGKILGYAKLGWNQETYKLVENEGRILELLSSQKLEKIIIPKLLFSDKFETVYLIIESAPDSSLKSFPPKLNRITLQILINIASINIEWQPFHSSIFKKEIESRISLINEHYIKHFLLKGIAQISQFTNNSLMPFHFSHGDFAPWNIKFFNDDIVYIFDWEYGQILRSGAYDLIHFIVQTSWLLKNNFPLKTVQLIFGLFQSDQFGFYWEFLKIKNKRELEILLLCYLLDRLSFIAAFEQTEYDKIHYLFRMFQIMLYRIDQ